MFKDTDPSSRTVSQAVLIGYASLPSRPVYLHRIISHTCPHSELLPWQVSHLQCHHVHNSPQNESIGRNLFPCLASFHPLITAGERKGGGLGGPKKCQMYHGVNLPRQLRGSSSCLVYLFARDMLA